MRWTTLAGLGLGVLAGTALLARGHANSKRLEITRETVMIPELPPAFDHFRLLHLTDMHLRKHSSVPELLLAKVQECAPDLVCLTGDFVFTALSLPAVERFLAALAQCTTAVAVYGNADYRPGVTPEARERWASYLPFLNNSALCLEREGDYLWLAGVDDPHLGRDSVPTAMTMVPPAVPVILLAHSPEVIERSLDPRIRLILSGHTHGGQICLPGGRALYHNTSLPPEYSSGRHQIGNAVLYISRGIGATRLPLRYACLPEITLFTLERTMTSAGNAVDVP